MRPRVQLLVCCSQKLWHKAKSAVINADFLTIVARFAGWFRRHDGIMRLRWILVMSAPFPQECDGKQSFGDGRQVVAHRIRGKGNGCEIAQVIAVSLRWPLVVGVNNALVGELRLGFRH